MDIPDNWTFKTKEIAQGFDNHVREQLPWYDLATDAVAHIARHYIPTDGLVYDIGASTGNIGNSIRDIIEDRHCTFVAIEESQEMANQYRGPGRIVVADAAEYDYEPFDFAVCFLLVMFLPIHRRRGFLNELKRKLRPGGAIVIVDKVTTPGGYAGTVLRRMAMKFKLDAGVDAESVLKKELSLAGYQRPIDPSILDIRAVQFLQFGEFCGWIIDSPS